jgi:oligosaccharide repeat unit polymerase
MVSRQFSGLSSPAFAHVIIGCVLLLAAVLWSSLSACPPAVTMLFFLLVLVLFNYKISEKDILYPPFLFCSAWFAVTIVYVFSPIKIDNIEWKTMAIFTGGAAFFSFGSLITNLSAGGQRKTSLSMNAGNRTGILILAAYCVLILPFFILDTIRIAGSFNLSAQFFGSIRSVLIDPEVTNPYSNKLISSAPFIAILTSWLLILERERKAIVFGAGCSATIMCLLLGARGRLLQLICGWIVLLIFRHADRSLKNIGSRFAVVGIAVIGFMTLLTFILKSETQAGEGMNIAANMTVSYIAGPLAGFNYQVEHPSLFRDQPQNTFVIISDLLTKSGLANVKSLKIKDEDVIYIPFPFNVFTIYKPYYHDYGALGCMVALTVLGACYGALFRSARKGNPLSMFMLAGLTQSLIMSVYHDEYSNQLLPILYMALFGLFYLRFLRRLPGLVFLRSPDASRLLVRKRIGDS